jgi:hypothetical protein
MVRDLSAERRSLLNESPTELAARVERNRIWMDRYGGDRQVEKAAIRGMK